MSLHDDWLHILDIDTKETKPKKSIVPSTYTHHSTNDFFEELINIPITTRSCLSKSLNRSSTQEEEAMWGEFDDNAFSNLCDTSSNEERKTIPKENNDYDDHIQIGFKTASGKLLKPVSEEAVKRARALLSEPTQDPLDNQKFLGFKTASGKELKPVSEEAMLKARSMLNEAVNEQSLDHKLDKQEFSGFKTASGKQLKPVSPAALEKAKALLVEKVENVSLIKETAEKSQRVNTMFTTASGKILTAAKKETEKWSTALFEAQENGVKRPLEMIKNIPVKGGLQDISNVKRQKKSTLGKRNKPFKSPIIPSNIELTKAAIGNKSKLRPKDESVLDLTAPNQQNKITSLGNPQQYTRQQLLSKDIQSATPNGLSR